MSESETAPRTAPAHPEASKDERGHVAGELSIFDRPAEIPDDLRRDWATRGWPDDLLVRALNLRVPTADLRWWVGHPRPNDLRDVERFLESIDRLMHGTMRVREVTWADNERVANLYANSPEDIGDWEVTVERSPYAFAQFRLQEHPNIQILEDRGVVLAAMAHAARNSYVHGKRTTLHMTSAWRVRKEFRGQGMSILLRTGEAPACAWFGPWSYYYIRPQNIGAYGWLQALLKGRQELPDAEEQVPGIPVHVAHFQARPFNGDASGIRPVRRRDARRCIALINRTHKGLDFFRPYTRDFFELRMDDPSWGEKPGFWPPVYGWPDYFALEEDGVIAAAAGLWDKGANVREVWRHKETGETKTIDSTALMDFGYAEGCEGAMARLIRYLIGRTHALGRMYLAVPLQWLPNLAACLTDLDPTVETRSLHYQHFDDKGGALHFSGARPYTDLAYW